MFKSLSPKDATKILKSRQKFFLDKSTKDERKIGKKNHEMEDDVMKNIDDLWDEKKRVSRTLVFRHTCKKILVQRRAIVQTILTSHEDMVLPRLCSAK